MTDIDKRLSILSGRTSREAWLQLQRMRHHPNVGALLAYLEQVGGAIRDADVHEAMRRFLDDHKENT